MRNDRHAHNTLLALADIETMKKALKSNGFTDLGVEQIAEAGKLEQAYMMTIKLNNN